MIWTDVNTSLSILGGNGEGDADRKNGVHGQPAGPPNQIAKRDGDRVACGIGSATPSVVLFRAATHPHIGVKVESRWAASLTE